MNDSRSYQQILTECAYNLDEVAAEQIAFDVSTDAWNKLASDVIFQRQKALQEKYDDNCCTPEQVFPFKYFLLLSQGRYAESLLYSLWQGSDHYVAENIVFPSTRYHQYHAGLLPLELPDQTLFKANAIFAGNIDMQALTAACAEKNLAAVCIEAINNAAGGAGVSMQNIQAVKALCQKKNIPLILDASRVVSNAVLIKKYEQGYGVKTLWHIVREFCSYADAVMISLSKEFAINKGAIIACNNSDWYQQLKQKVHYYGSGLSLLDKKMIHLALANQTYIETAVIKRQEQIVWLSHYLQKANIPVLAYSGISHCILFDLQEFMAIEQYQYPEQAFLQCLYQYTGIRLSTQVRSANKLFQPTRMVRLVLMIAYPQEDLVILAERLKKVLLDILDNRIEIKDLRKDTTFSFPTYQQISLEKKVTISSSQRRLWLLDKIEPENRAYNICMVLELQGLVDVARLKYALHKVIQRHDVLRAYFKENRNTQTVMQHIRSTLNFHLQPESLLDLSKADQYAYLQEKYLHTVQSKFDLQNSALVHFQLFALAADQFVLFVAIHHSITDGWSLGLFVKEMMHYYLQPDKALVNLPIQYADYARQQEQWIKSEKAQKMLAYWQQTLTDLPPVLMLPTDKPRRQVQSTRGARLYRQFPATLTQQLNQYAQQQQVTLFMLLLSAFKVLLLRYTEQEDILVGSPVANRTSNNTQDLMGFFVNTLVLRTQLDSKADFLEVLKKVKASTLGAYKHQAYPFESLVEIINPERSLGHSPFFQVMFTFQNFPLPAIQSETLSVHPVNLSQPDNKTLAWVGNDTHTAMFDLTLEITERPEGLVAALEYNTDLFEQTSIARMFEHLQRILKTVLLQPEIPIQHIPLITEEEQQLLQQWNDTEKDFFLDNKVNSVQQLFEQQVEATPNAIALQWQQQGKKNTLSYQQLNTAANQLAHYLQSLEIKENSLIAVCLERSANIVITILAILKTGSAYVPLDPSYPHSRLAWIIQDSEAEILITETALTSIVESLAITYLLYLDQLADTLSAYRTDNVDIAINPEQLIYVIYTSGSTGKPKGTAVPHRGFLNLLCWFREDYAFDENDSNILLTAIGFDLTQKNIFAPLLTGGQLFIPRWQHYDPAQIVNWIKEYNITWFNATPSMLDALLQRAKMTDDYAALASLRYVFLGGETLNIEVFADWLDHPLCQAKIVNMYGPTEASDITTAITVQNNEQERLSGVSIGKPISNVSCYVVDKHLQAVFIGGIGELCVGGKGIAKGYLNQPLLTAEKFIPDPFSNKKDAVMYRTGDLVRWNHQGELMFMGRIDHQVKIRGFRIELGEIEAQLRLQDKVNDALVCTYQDADKPVQLCAYIQPEGIIDNTARQVLQEQLQQALQAELPDYMIPSWFVIIDHFPLNAHGKVDRKALPRPDTDVEARIAPSTHTEEILVAIWSEVLKRENIGVSDNFFSLGGHSLLISQVANRIYQRFALEVALRVLFELPTIVALARHIDTLLENAGELTIDLEHLANLDQSQPHTNIPVIDRSQNIALSYAQQRLWFIEQMQPGNAWYNMPACFVLQGELNITALQQAFQALMMRHEILRSRFCEHHGQAQLKFVDNAKDFDLGYEDCSHLSTVQQQAVLEQIQQQQVSTGFDLAHTSPLRTRLIQLAPEKYQLFATLHHIVADGWSVNILLDEIHVLYQAFDNDQQVDLAPLTIQYADFAQWQKDLLAGERLEKQCQYWQQKLCDVEILELPTDYPRPASQSFHGAHISFSFDASISIGLLALAKQSQCTLFMLLLAAYKTLLFRYTEQTDICVGTPVAGRTHQDTEALIGFFINSLAIRDTLQADMPFIQLLQQLRETTLDAFAHQDVPFEKLLDELGIERDMSYSPIFQVMFNLHALHIPDRPLSEKLQLHTLEVETGVAKFDWIVEIDKASVETGQALQGRIEYNTDIFSVQRMQRFIQHFECLLQGVIANPETVLGQLPLLPEQEYNQLIYDWNDTSTDIPSELAFQQFQLLAQTQPDSPALIWQQQQISYGALNQRANQLAHYLLAHYGVLTEAIIALLFQPGIDLFVALLAVAKSGASYLALDPQVPKQRLNFMLKDSSSKILLCNDQQFDDFNALLDVINLSQSADVITQQVQDNPDTDVSCENRAYVIYTSGSSGTPKGVEITQANLRHFASSFAQQYRLDKNVRMTQIASFAFDASVLEIWPVWVSGGCLYPVPKDILLDTEALYQWLNRHQISHSFLTTAMVDNFLQLPIWEQSPQESSLRILHTGGEKLTVRPKPYHPFQLINHYGPTEATVLCTSEKVSNTDTDASPGIGKPVANTHIYILDKQQQAMPIGVAGELYIAGAGVGRGYLNRAELTAKAFLTNPFSNHSDSHRMYRSGDKVRWLENGTLEYISRMDDQIKLRGFRIELGEIESVLCQAQGVQDAIVLLREDSPGKKRLVAYLLPETGEILEIALLRPFLQKRLAEYMLPAAFVVLERIPLTSNGKINKRALPIPEQANKLADDVAQPRTPLETDIREIWAEVLGLDSQSIGITDNFFYLGGHSLLATQVIARIREVLQTEIELRWLFETPSIGALAEKMTQQQMQQQMPIPVREEAAIIPLSYAQQRLWILEQYQPDTALYNIAASVHFEGHLDAELLRQSFTELVQRHSILRTRFIADDSGQVTQQIQVLRRWELLQLDWQALTPTTQQEHLQQLAQQEACYRFDLQQDNLLRTSLVQLNAQQSVLLLCIHHIIADGWSMGVLVQELATIYHAFSQGKTIDLPELAIQYADFSCWQRHYLQGDILDQHIQYWTQQLKEVPILELAYDFPRPPVQTLNGQQYTFVVAAEQLNVLKNFAQQQGITLFMLLLAAWSIILSRYSGQQDFCIGSPVANRGRRELECLIGFFVNTLVLRCRIDPWQSVEDFLAEIKATTLAAYTHQDAPFEQVVDALQLERNLTYPPLFQVMLSLQNTPVQTIQLPDITMRTEGIDIGLAKFDLNLDFVEKQGQLCGNLEFNTDLFLLESIQAMVDNLLRLLHILPTMSDKAIEQLSLLSDTEQQHLFALAQGSQTTLTTASIIEQFEQQVAATPAAIAVIDEQQHSSYQQLNQKANQLAYYLQQQGIQAGDKVAVCLPRKGILLEAILAILKTGAAYVPMDPSYPVERLVYIYQNSQAKLLLTETAMQAFTKIETDCCYLDTLNTDTFSKENLALEYDIDNLFYMIYTSGSTGQPKGTLLAQRGFINLLSWYTQHFQIGVQDKNCLVSAIGFDLTQKNLFATLLTGGVLVLPTMHLFDPAHLLAILQQHQISIINSTPSIFDSLLEYAKVSENYSALATLRYVFLGGEPVHLRHYQQWQAHSPSSTQLVNTYGPTECTDVVAYYIIPSDYPLERAIPLGHAIDNMQLYIMDKEANILPQGAKGEIVIAGIGVGQGYLEDPNDPEQLLQQLNQEKFNTIVLNQQSCRIYRTGDWGRYNRDGQLEFLGRMDQQIKLRGFRIELGEIEFALQAHPAIQEAVVLIIGEQDNARLIAWIHTQEKIPKSELKRFLEKYLPAYMLPHDMVLMSTFPLTANGKVDKNALPLPDRDIAKENYVAPANALEEELVAMWQEVLKIEHKISVEDDFFALGGNSLLATQIVAKVRSQYQIELALRALFETPTIIALAKYIHTAKESGAILQETVITARSRNNDNNNTTSNIIVDDVDEDEEEFEI